VGALDPATGSLNTEVLLNPQRLNKYAYGLNNSYRFIDPDGNVSLSITKYGFSSIVPTVGWGGTFSCGYKNGVVFWNVSEVGFGFGEGVFLDLKGGPPKQLELTKQEKEAGTFGMSIAGSVSAEFLGCGLNYQKDYVVVGRVSNDENGKTSYSHYHGTSSDDQTSNGVTMKFKPKFSAGVSAGAGASSGRSWRINLPSIQDIIGK
jgi:hypothetical protein